MRVDLKNGEVQVRVCGENVHPSYPKAVKLITERLIKIFDSAQEKCESEFIAAMLEIDFLNPNYKPTKALEFTYDLLNDIKNKKKYRGERSIPLALVMYGQILEADGPYDLLASLLNVIEGDRAKIINNFTTREDRDDIYPSDKIDQLTGRAKKLGYDLNFLQKMHSETLRNGVYHSNYSINDDHSVEVKHRGVAKKYDRDEWHSKVNEAIAFYEAIQALKNAYIRSYTEPVEVEMHPSFSDLPLEKGITIIRKGKGIIGIRNAFTRPELTEGVVPWHFGSLLPYEVALVSKGDNVLPYNRIHIFNRVISPLPDFIKTRLVSKFSKLIRGN